jgi:hypothetical protein
MNSPVTAARARERDLDGPDQADFGALSLSPCQNRRDLSASLEPFHSETKQIRRRQQTFIANARVATRIPGSRRACYARQASDAAE